MLFANNSNPRSTERRFTMSTISSYISLLSLQIALNFSSKKPFFVYLNAVHWIKLCCDINTVVQFQLIYSIVQVSFGIVFLNDIIKYGSGSHRRQISISKKNIYSKGSTLQNLLRDKLDFSYYM